VKIFRGFSPLKYNGTYIRTDRTIPFDGLCQSQFLRIRRVPVKKGRVININERFQSLVRCCYMKQKHKTHNDLSDLYTSSFTHNLTRVNLCELVSILVFTPASQMSAPSTVSWRMAFISQDFYKLRQNYINGIVCNTYTKTEIKAQVKVLDHGKFFNKLLSAIGPLKATLSNIFTLRYLSGSHQRIRRKLLNRLAYRQAKVFLMSICRIIEWLSNRWGWPPNFGFPIQGCFKIFLLNCCNRNNLGSSLGRSSRGRDKKKMFICADGLFQESFAFKTLCSQHDLKKTKKTRKESYASRYLPAQALFFFWFSFGFVFSFVLPT